MEITRKRLNNFCVEVLLASIFIVVLSLFTIGISWFIRTNNYFYVPNIFTFGIAIPPVLLALILVVVTALFFYFDLFQNHLIPTILMLTGGWSNGLEKFIFGSVTDYIPFSNGYLNIADIMIWSGLIWLNIVLWFLPRGRKKTESKPSNG